MDDGVVEPLRYGYQRNLADLGDEARSGGVAAAVGALRATGDQSEVVLRRGYGKNPSGIS
jgi:hypothetical protein